MSKEFVLNMQKSITWEEAKLKLRTFANLVGHQRLALEQPNSLSLKNAEDHWEIVNERIEKFIEQFEEDGMHE